MDFSEVARRVQEAGGVEAAQKKSEEFYQQAKEALEGLRSPSSKNHLTSFLDEIRKWGNKRGDSLSA